MAELIDENHNLRMIYSNCASFNSWNIDNTISIFDDHLNSLMNTHEDFSHKRVKNLQQFHEFIKDNLVDSDDLFINAYKFQSSVISILSVLQSYKDHESLINQKKIY